MAKEGKPCTRARCDDCGRYLPVSTVTLGPVRGTCGQCGDVAASVVDR